MTEVKITEDKILFFFLHLYNNHVKVRLSKNRAGGHCFSCIAHEEGLKGSESLLAAGGRKRDGQDCISPVIFIIILHNSICNKGGGCLWQNRTL